MEKDLNKKILFIALVTGLITYNLYIIFEPKEVQVSKNLMPVKKYQPIVRLMNGNNEYCTGSVLTLRTVLTAKHCVLKSGDSFKDEIQIEISPATDDSVKIKGIVYNYLQNQDQVLIEGNFSNFYPLPYAKDNKTIFNAFTEQELTSCGYVGEHGLVCLPFTLTNIYSIDNGGFELKNNHYSRFFTFSWALEGTQQVMAGMSGGPVMDKNGVLIAINTAYLNYGKKESLVSPIYNISDEVR